MKNILVEIENSIQGTPTPPSQGVISEGLVGSLNSQSCPAVMKYPSSSGGQQTPSGKPEFPLPSYNNKAAPPSSHQHHVREGLLKQKF